LSQSRIGAIDLIAGDPRRGRASLQRADDQLAGQGRFRRELHVVGHTGRGTALRVISPGLRQVQRSIDKCVALAGGVAQIHRDLGVFDATGGAGVLALHPDGVSALLQITGLVDDEHRLGRTEVLHNVAAQVLTHSVVVPHSPAQQVLQTLRGGVSNVLSDRPAVL
jgi:hypothetical protein